MDKLTVKLRGPALSALRRRAEAEGISLSELVRQKLAVEEPLDLSTYAALVQVARRRASDGTLTSAERRKLRELARLIVAAVQERDRDVVEQLTAGRRNN